MSLSSLARLGVVSLMLVGPGTVLADEGADATVETPMVQYASETRIDFENLDVTAEIQAPDGRVVFERRRAEFAPMIRLRTDFNQEVAVSVDLMN